MFYDLKILRQRWKHLDKSKRDLWLGIAFAALVHSAVILGFILFVYVFWATMVG